MQNDELERRLAANLPVLEAFVGQRVGAALRAHESCRDVVQSICRGLVEDAGGLQFDDDAAFRAWLFRAAAHKVRDRARHHGRGKRDVQRVVGGSIGAELAAAYARPGSPSPSAALMSAEEIARIEAAFAALATDHREVITLARLAALPLHQVGELMGKRSPAAISMLLGRALAALDDLLRRD